MRAHPATTEAPIVVLGADTTRRAHDPAIGAGATAFVSRPIDTECLLALLSKLAGPL